MVHVKNQDPKRHSYEEKIQAIHCIIKVVVVGPSASNVGETSVSRWINVFRRFGPSGLKRQSLKSPCIEQKAVLVREVLDKSLSCESVALRHGRRLWLVVDN